MKQTDLFAFKDGDVAYVPYKWGLMEVRIEDGWLLGPKGWKAMLKHYERVLLREPKTNGVVVR